MDAVREEKSNSSPLLIGLVFAALIIATNMIWTEGTRQFITKNLRSPGAHTLCEALTYVPAFTAVGKNHFLDADSFVRIKLLSNFALLTVFFLYLGFWRQLQSSAVRLSYRLLAGMGVVYLGVLLFDPIALGQTGSAIQWFQSAGFVACATAAVLNYVIVRQVRESGRTTSLGSFWVLATGACFFAALSTQFGLSSTFGGTVQAALSRLGIADVYASVGMPLSRPAPLFLTAITVLVAASFLRSFRRFYGSNDFSWHKPFLFALGLQLAASATRFAPESATFAPWLNQVRGLADTATFVVLLAAFSTTAMWTARRYYALSETGQLVPVASRSEEDDEAPRLQSGPPIVTTVDETEQVKSPT